MSDGSWFSANRSTVKRSEGRNAVAAAAYYTGSKLYDATERTLHDFSRKRGVVEAFVTTPYGKDNLEWAHDVERLSTVMESSEKRKDAQVGHVWRFSLPDAVSEEQRSAIAIEAAQKLSDLYGVAVIGGVHLPDEKGDDRNHHCHLLFTTRAVEADGKLGAKVTSITSPKTAQAEVTRYREIVADLINDALEEAGSDERVSHLSYAARGIDKIPTVHLGPAASGQERRGEPTDRGDINRAIIEERLAWQAGIHEAQEAIAATTAEIDRELSVRFGDDFAAVLKEARAGEPLPGIGEHARQDAQPLREDTASSARRDMLAEPRGWRERIKALASYALDFIHDESDAPTRAPEAQESQPDLNAATPPPAPEPAHPVPGLRSWMARVMESRAMQAGRKLLHGWSHRDGEEMAEGVKEAGDFLKARVFPTGDEDAFREAVRDTVAEGPRHPVEEIARRRAETGTNGGGAATGSQRDLPTPDGFGKAGRASVWRDQQGSVLPTEPEPSATVRDPFEALREARPAANPASALERLMARASGPEAKASQPVSALDRLAQAQEARLAAQVGEPEAGPKPMTAFERLAAEYFASIGSGEAGAEADDPQAYEPPTPELPAPEPDYGPDIG